MYYQLVCSYGERSRRSVNVTSTEDVKESLLDLIEPQICEDDKHDYKKASLASLCEIEGYELQKSETPFPEYEIDE